MAKIELKFNDIGSLKSANTKAIEGVDSVLILKDGLPIVKYNIENLQIPERPERSALNENDFPSEFEGETEALRLKFLKQLYEEAKEALSEREQVRFVEKTAEQKRKEREKKLKEKQSIKSFINGTMNVTDLTEDDLMEGD